MVRPDGRVRLRDLRAALGRLDYSSIVLATGFVVLFFNSGTRYAFGLMLKPMTDDLGVEPVGAVACACSLHAGLGPCDAPGRAAGGSV